MTISRTGMLVLGALVLMAASSHAAVFLRGGGLAAPVNTVAPVVTGDNSLGQLKTCSPGTWTGSPAFTYQWYYSVTGVDPFSSLGGDYTAATIFPTGEGGFFLLYLRCEVTGTNAAGSASANSNVIGPMT